jgi:RHS repeat-associated protein
VKTTYTNDLFGNVTVSGETSDNPFQYTGGENDGTGLYYYRARNYSPGLQRFISEDPVGLAGGINQFAYVGNDPLNHIDPDGLEAGAPPYLPPPGWWYMPPPPPRGPGAGEPPPGTKLPCSGGPTRVLVCEKVCADEPVKDTCYVKDVKKCYYRNCHYEWHLVCHGKDYGPY